MAGYARRVVGKAARGRPQEHNSANVIYVFASRRRHGSRVHISEATASTCHAARRLPCSHMLVLLRGRLVKRCTRVPCHEYDGGQANDNSLDQELLKQVSIASLRHALPACGRTTWCRTHRHPWLDYAPRADHWPRWSRLRPKTPPG